MHHRFLLEASSMNEGLIAIAVQFHRLSYSFFFFGLTIFVSPLLKTSSTDPFVP